MSFFEPGLQQTSLHAPHKPDVGCQGVMMAGSQTTLPRSGWMQLQPVPTRQSSVTEKQLHFSVPKVGRGAWLDLGFIPTPLLEFTQPNCQHSVRVSKNPARHWTKPSLAQQRRCQPRTAAATGSPECPRPAEGHCGRNSAHGCPGRGHRRPPACPLLRGSASLSPAGPGGDRARCPGLALTTLPSLASRRWPGAGGSAPPLPPARPSPGDRE